MTVNQEWGLYSWSFIILKLSQGFIQLYAGLEISKQWNQQINSWRIAVYKLPFPVYQLPACVALRTFAIFPPILINYWLNFTKHLQFPHYQTNTISSIYSSLKYPFPALCHCTILCCPCALVELGRRVVLVKSASKGNQSCVMGVGMYFYSELQQLVQKCSVTHFLYPSILTPPPSLSFGDQYAFRPTGSPEVALITLLHHISFPYSKPVCNSYFCRF